MWRSRLNGGGAMWRSDIPVPAPSPEFAVGQRVLIDAPGRAGDGMLGVVERYAEEDVGGMLVTRYVVRFEGKQRFMTGEFESGDLLPL
jgi:hypothetical protein